MTAASGLLKEYRLTEREAMNSHNSTNKDGGFTFIDLLIVVVTAPLLFSLASIRPYRHRHGCGRNRINCVSNLKQVGLGSRIWSNDHQDKFPWMISTNEGGTREYVKAAEVFRHFEIASNEFNSPKILVCLEDRGRARATSFYLVANPRSILQNLTHTT